MNNAAESIARRITFTLNSLGDFMQITDDDSNVILRGSIIWRGSWGVMTFGRPDIDGGYIGTVGEVFAAERRSHDENQRVVNFETLRIKIAEFIASNAELLDVVNGKSDETVYNFD